MTAAAPTLADSRVVSDVRDTSVAGRARLVCGIIISHLAGRGRLAAFDLIREGLTLRCLDTIESSARRAVLKSMGPRVWMQLLSPEHVVLRKPLVRALQFVDFPPDSSTPELIVQVPTPRPLASLGGATPLMHALFPPRRR